MAGPTTNAEIRDRYENGKQLVDGPKQNVVEDSPANGAETAVGADTDVHKVNPDGTNAVNLDNAADEGREVMVAHNGGANTPTLSFADADFVGTGPADMTNAGATATLVNVDGTNSGWVVKSTGSA
jgi:hypothetical protein